MDRDGCCPSLQSIYRDAKLHILGCVLAVFGLGMALQAVATDPLFWSGHLSGTLHLLVSCFFLILGEGHVLFRIFGIDDVGLWVWGGKGRFLGTSAGFWVDGVRRAVFGIDGV